MATATELKTDRVPATRTLLDSLVEDLWTVDGENATQCDADCGRPYGSAGGNGDSGDGEPNPPTGDGDDGRPYGG